MAERYISDDEAALRRAIEDAPEDEAPHKAFADWLDEHDCPEEAAYHRRWTIAVAVSEKWLQDFCVANDCPNYDVMMQALKTGRVPGDESDNPHHGYFRVEWPAEWDSEFLHFGGRDAHGDIPPEFWNHVETALGIKVGPEKRCTGFSCSC